VLSLYYGAQDPAACDEGPAGLSVSPLSVSAMTTGRPSANVNCLSVADPPGK